eukprot:scaffold96_cov172-Amphora_coffeaeformis.AAC.1
MMIRLPSHELARAVTVRLVLCAILAAGQDARLVDANHNTVHVGIMITATELQGPDNGLIVVLVEEDRDPSSSFGGSILRTQLVSHFSTLVSTHKREDPRNTLAWYQSALSNHHLVKHKPQKVVVHVGRDTHETSEFLAQLVVETATATGEDVAVVVDHGEISTPCLHFCVHHHYSQNNTISSNAMNGDDVVDLYHHGLAQAYTNLMASSAQPSTTNSLLVDCAGGVGFLAVRQVVSALQQQQHCHRRIVATNRIGSAPLHQACGAHYVTTTQQPPTWYNAPPIGKTTCASLSGDADRVVFFSQTEPTHCVLWNALDVLVLVVDFICGQVAAAAERTATNTILAVVVQIHDSYTQQKRLLQNILGERVVLMTREERGEPSYPIEDAILLDVDADGRMRCIIWNANHRNFWKSSTVLQNVRVLFSSYPDGLALMLLVDAILHVQNKSDWCNDWERLFSSS